MAVTGRKSRYTIGGGLPMPPALAMDASAAVRMATRERLAVDALLAHQATAEHIGVLEAMAECAIRAIRHARKLSYCRHLDAGQLDACERVMQRAGHALARAKDRHAATGVFGLDATDRACVQDLDEWHGAMTQRGAIPRAVWLMAYRDGVQRRGSVVLPPWESLA